MEREANGLDRNGFVRVGGLGVCDADEISRAGGLGRVHLDGRGECDEMSPARGGRGRDALNQDGGGRGRDVSNRDGGGRGRDVSNRNGGGWGRDELSRAGGLGRVHRNGGQGHNASNRAGGLGVHNALNRDGGLGVRNASNRAGEGETEMTLMAAYEEFEKRRATNVEVQKCTKLFSTHLQKWRTLVSINPQ